MQKGKFFDLELVTCFWISEYEITKTFGSLTNPVIKRKLDIAYVFVLTC
jgi:hypothetical protein